MSERYPAASPEPLTDIAQSPFERYMLLDDRADYPMTFHFVIEFDGLPDQDLLKSSFVASLARHPLLSAVPDGHRWRFRSPCEEVSSRTYQVLKFGETPEPTEAFEAIDLRRELGIRVWVETSKDGTRITMCFHHASCDGIGALRFLGDWLASYHAASTGEPLTQIEYSFSALTQRARSRWKNPGVPVSLWTSLKAQFRESWKWFRQKPTPLALAKPQASAFDLQPFPGIMCHEFDQETTRLLRKSAVKSGVGLNDLLLTALFDVLGDWNRERKLGRESDWLRITVPTSLRDKADDAVSAANIIGYVFVTRPRRECGTDSASLAKSIAGEMQLVRNWNAGMFFLSGIEMLDRLPGALKYVTSSRSCRATTVFTNLGDVSRRMGAKLPKQDGYLSAGGLRMRSITGAPPMRPGTRAVFSAFIYAERLTLGLRSDPRAFDETESKQLLSRFIKRVSGF